MTLAWGPSAAHLFELPAKLDMGPSDYLTVQQIYRGWALFGFVFAGELVALVGFAWTSRRTRWSGLALAALIAVATKQAVFWIFTAPTNRATGQWTSLPSGWETLRMQWEYSHAAGAGLCFVALMLLWAAAARMLRRRDPTV